MTPLAVRLLYRGALSLPDSHLLLDGLTFSARLSPDDLLHNPLALALESMRGRPLRLLGTVSLDSLGTGKYLDDTTHVSLDIHPLSTLSRIYFENIFCLKVPTLPSGSTKKGTTNDDVGVKVTFGDGETTEIVIYARPSPSASHELALHVARIVPVPPKGAPSRIFPRPDDPTPRKPPVLSRTDSSRKRRKLDEPDLPPPLGATSSSLKVGGGKDKDAASLFKVPVIPARNGAAAAALSGTKGKGKGKARDTGGGEGGRIQPQLEEEDEIESANKLLIKTLAQHHLSRPPYLVGRTHPEFRELWGAIYRGVAFALRTEIRAERVEPAEVDRLVSIHLSMYVKPQNAGQGSRFTREDG